MMKLTSSQIEAFLLAFPSTTRDEPMAQRTYLKIGGPARLFLVADQADELIRAVQTAKAQGIPWYVFGGGSNLLVADGGFEGLVVQAANRSFSIDGTKVTAAAGLFTGLLARDVAKQGLTGFEWGIGVPGTIGGATYGNAGCFGGEMKDAVLSVEAYDVRQDVRVVYSNEECHFGYRDSRFKHEPYLLLTTTLQLQPGDPVEAMQKLEGVMSKRKETQPQGAFSAGCLFKNFEYADESALELLQRRGDDIPPEMLKNKRIAAGWLIEKLGLKGTSIGKAQVSPVHGNFLVNQGGATAADVVALSSLVKMRVRDELGILLENEVQLLGF